MDFLLNILSHWESALAVLLVLGGLIFFHELGHFAVARLFRCLLYTSPSPRDLT